MKLKQLWIALVLTLSFHSSYSQYPVKRIFKGDSVVMMTVGQADTINLLYKSYNDAIVAYKDSLSFKNKQYVSTVSKLRNKEDSINIYRFHIENIKPGSIDEKFKEELKRTQEINRMWVFLLFMALALAKSQN